MKFRAIAVAAFVLAASSLYAEYGEGAPGGAGPSQASMQDQGNAYLSAFPGCPLNEIGGSNQAAEQREKAQQAPQPRAPSDLSDGHEGSRT